VLNVGTVCIIPNMIAFFGAATIPGPLQAVMISSASDEHATTAQAATSDCAWHVIMNHRAGYPGLGCVAARGAHVLCQMPCLV
jgi:hypothetical protein